jgi:spore coat protein U-like protein
MITRFLIALALLIGWAASAEAACTVASFSPVTFGAASSYDVRESNVAKVMGSAGFTCNGSIISVVSSNTAQARATSANGFTLRNTAGNAIAYRLSADSAGSYSFNGGQTIDYFNPSLLSLLGILNGGTMISPVYAALTASPNVPAGTYTDTVTMQWSWQVCHGVGVGGVCVLSESGTATATVSITLVVGTDCRISAPNLSFGSAPLVTGFAPVSQAVAVDCTLGASYTVAFSSGSNGSARPWRAMTSSAGNSLQYNIYRSDGTTIWDETTPLTSAVAGTGGTTPTLQTYVARINAAQVTPPPGAYTDNVSVIVTF